MILHLWRAGAGGPGVRALSCQTGCCVIVIRLCPCNQTRRYCKVRERICLCGSGDWNVQCRRRFHICDVGGRGDLKAGIMHEDETQFAQEYKPVRGTAEETSFPKHDVRFYLSET